MFRQQRVQRRYVPGSPNWISLQKAVEYVRKHGVSFEKAEKIYNIPRATIQRHYWSKYNSKPRSIANIKCTGALTASTIGNIQTREGTVFVADAKDTMLSHSDLGPIDEFNEFIEEVIAMDDDKFGEFLESLRKENSNGCVMNVDEDERINQFDF